MDYILMAVVAIGLIVWYIRPLYNFMAKRKYLLLDVEKMTMTRKVQTALPAIIFYALLLGLIMLPSYVSEQVTANQTTSILVVQIVFIFLFTRYDKWQTKYSVEDEGVRFKRRYIRWDEPYSLKFKKSAFFILHKPRFILKSKKHVIVIPMLSHKIERFIARLSFTNKDLGFQVRELYENTRAYYIKNIEVEKELNKLGK